MIMRRTIATVVTGLALLVALDGFAQTRAAGFSGNWLRDWPAVADNRPLPKFILQVALNDTTLAVAQQSGQSTRTATYRLEQPTDRGVPLDRTGRTFKWMAPDRLEVRDLIVESVSRSVAVTESWELRDGGRVLRISRTLRSLDEVSAKPEVRVSTFQRE